MQGPVARMLDRQRLHLNHGPIDLIVQAWGRDRAQALRQAEARFQTVLDELVGELDLLRAPLGQVLPKGTIAGRMARSVAPFKVFVTPMAAVAGAVADEVCAAMCAGLSLERAYVNNGGDIAIYLGEGQALEAAIAGLGQVSMSADQAARGLASSGWRGRSHSLGIADTVSVLALDAAGADVAATLIANAVDLPVHPAVKRQRADDLQPDSDIGARLVTVDVGALSEGDISTALDAGEAEAQAKLADGHILAAALFLADQVRLVGVFPRVALNGSSG
jgi:uncharacterized protein